MLFVGDRQASNETCKLCEIIIELIFGVVLLLLLYLLNKETKLYYTTKIINKLKQKAIKQTTRK